MEGNYEILEEGRSVGTVSVFQCGLYYRFLCHCGAPHRITVSCGGKNTELGLCVPTGTGFGIDTRIPAKKIGNGELAFFAQVEKSGKEEIFFPVSGLEPCTCIEKLRYARIAEKNGQLGVLIPYGNEISKPTGQ